MRRRLLIPGLLVAGLLAASPARAASITFASLSIAQGGSFILPILGSGFNDDDDLFTFSFDLSFDPAILEATAIREGEFLPSAVTDPNGGTVFFPGEILPGVGLITLNLSTLFGETQLGATGSGILAYIDFQTRGAGDAGLALSNVLFFDSAFPQGNEIDANILNGAVRVEATTPVPEPSTLGLMGMGLFALARRLRRKPAIAGSTNPSLV
jgi:hypothetical protein